MCLSGKGIYHVSHHTAESTFTIPFVWGCLGTNQRKPFLSTLALVFSLVISHSIHQARFCLWQVGGPWFFVSHSLWLLRAFNLGAGRKAQLAPRTQGVKTQGGTEPLLPVSSCFCLPLSCPHFFSPHPASCLPHTIQTSLLLLLVSKYGQPYIWSCFKSGWGDYCSQPCSSCYSLTVMCGPFGNDTYSRSTPTFTLIYPS